MAVRTTQGQTGRVRTGRVGAQGAGGATPPPPPSILLENGTDFLMMEDGTSFLLLES